jgi:hypothetical protein
MPLGPRPDGWAAGFPLADALRGDHAQTASEGRDDEIIALETGLASLRCSRNRASARRTHRNTDIGAHDTKPARSSRARRFERKRKKDPNQEAAALGARLRELRWKNSAWLATAETMAGWNGFEIRNAGSGRSPVRKRSG